MLWTLEHDETFVDQRELAPLRVGACKVNTQDASNGGIGVNEERLWIGHQAVRASGD